MEQTEINNVTFHRIDGEEKKKVLSKIGRSASVWKKRESLEGGGAIERRGRRVVVGQSRSRKNSNNSDRILLAAGGLDRNTMISPRDIDTNVEVVESRAVESSTWLERGRKPAQTRYAISYVRAQTETRQLISRLLDKISG